MAHQCSLLDELVSPNETELTVVEEAILIEHIRLRPIRLDQDVDTALAWYSDEEVLHFSEGAQVAPYQRDTLTRMYTYLSSIGNVYIIEVLTEEGYLPIGDATLSDSTLPIVIGHPAYRSRGIGGRVLELLIREAQRRGWRELHVKQIFEYNQRSLALFQQAGFTISRTYVHNGVTCYAMDKTLDS